MAEETTFRTDLRRHVVDPEKPPEVAHHFMLTRVGEEAVLEVGFVDLTAVAQAIIAGENAELTFYVSHRFSLGRQAQDRLLQVVETLRAPSPVGGGAGNAEST